MKAGIYIGFFFIYFSDDEGSVNVKLNPKSHHGLSAIKPVKPKKDLIISSKFQKLMAPSQARKEISTNEDKEFVTFPKMEVLNLSFLN